MEYTFIQSLVNIVSTELQNKILQIFHEIPNHTLYRW